MREIETEFPGYPLNHKGVYKGEYITVSMSVFECVHDNHWSRGLGLQGTLYICNFI